MQNKNFPLEIFFLGEGGGGATIYIPRKKIKWKHKVLLVVEMRRDFLLSRPSV